MSSKLTQQTREEAFASLQEGFIQQGFSCQDVEKAALALQSRRDQYGSFLGAHILRSTYATMQKAQGKARERAFVQVCGFLALAALAL